LRVRAHASVTNAEFETEDRFDLVFMRYVLEHVLDPVAAAAKIQSLLTEVLHDGNTTVYKVNGTLDASGCS
jgi:2-polyprenyl-3-methyl-5-hydroxy-6-metoxy-1,4-benzoquinol methylase